MRIQCCGTCGAVTGTVTWYGRKIIDNTARHERWHRENEQHIADLYLASCGETQARLAALIGGERYE